MSPSTRYRLALTLTCLSFGCGMLAVMAAEYVIVNFSIGPNPWPSKVSVAGLTSILLWPVGLVMALFGAFVIPDDSKPLRVANTLILLAFVGVTLFYVAISFFHPGSVR